VKGYIDSTAGEIQAGDTLIDPVSGVLARVESVEPVNAAGIVTLHMRGSVSLGYMGITGRPDRPLRRAPRPSDMTAPTVLVDQADGPPISVPMPISQCCPCGLKSRASCAALCLKG
jgi:hypothetical protein